MPDTTLEEGYALLIKTVIKKLQHKHYDRVTHLADLYTKLITGNKIEELLKRFVRREDDALFEQRKELTHAITPAVSEAIMSPFYKVGRVNSIIKNWIFEKTEDDKSQREELTNAIAKYNGDKSLDQYLQTRFVELSFTDPNAFIVTEFDQVPIGPQGEFLEKVSPRPFEVSSTEAINFFYDNNVLKWLIVRLDIIYVEGGVEKPGYSYTIYLPNNAIKFTRVASNRAIVPIEVVAVVETELGIQGYFKVSETELYLVEEFEYPANKVPAFRVGYKKDLVTKAETCVNPMHPALPYFMKTIKTVSEFDLTMALHAFPQKFQYAPRCLGESTEMPCDRGYTSEGKTCGKCKGTGYMIHTSAQDGVIIRLPKDPKDVVDLEQFVHYEYPPIDLLKFQDEFIKGLKEDALSAVFNSETYSKNEIVKTATEVTTKKDNAYDTLFPFAENYSEAYKHTVATIARFIDIKDLIVDHRFPKDFKFKTVSELLAELKMANESNAPGYIRQELSVDIAEKQFVDKPEELKRIKTKLKFYPFPDKTPTDIAFIISNNLTTKYNKVLWANFDQIFLEIENDMQGEEVDFYAMDAKLQKVKIDEKVKAIIDGITAEEPPMAVDFKNTPEEEEEPEEDAA